ncbi:hypothetical protein NC651_027283 [Populus alba x Populus x berolinensis]|nr:hypothetical protein NC651_027283 [Populus alba x Populus x berolinensis]
MNGFWFFQDIMDFHRIDFDQIHVNGPSLLSPATASSLSANPQVWVDGWSPVALLAAENVLL